HRILKTFSALGTLTAIYPPGHPLITEKLREADETIRHHLKDDDALRIDIIRGVVHLNGVPSEGRGDGHDGLPIDSLHIRRGVSVDEIATLAAFLGRGKLALDSPVAAQLTSRGVEHISVARLVPLDTRWRTHQWPERPTEVLDPDYEESLALAQQAFEQLSSDRLLDIRTVRDLVQLLMCSVVGGGYPDLGDGVVPHALSQIVSVADIYEAVTGARSYQSPTPPERACLLLARLAGSKLNAALVKAFVNAITFFPIGSIVRTNRGELAVVIQTNADDPLHPVVELVDEDIRGALGAADTRAR